MSEVKKRFLLCPIDNKITTYIDCSDCIKVLQIRIAGEEVTIECDHNHTSKFIKCIEANMLDFKDNDHEN